MAQQATAVRGGLKAGIANQRNPNHPQVMGDGPHPGVIDPIESFHQSQEEILRQAQLDSKSTKKARKTQRVKKAVKVRRTTLDKVKNMSPAVRAALVRAGKLPSPEPSSEPVSSKKTASESPKKKRGGARPGAGRPRGSKTKKRKTDSEDPMTTMKRTSQATSSQATAPPKQKPDTVSVAGLSDSGVQAIKLVRSNVMLSIREFKIRSRESGLPAFNRWPTKLQRAFEKMMANGLTTDGELELVVANLESGFEGTAISSRRMAALAMLMVGWNSLEYVLNDLLVEKASKKEKGVA